MYSPGRRPDLATSDFSWMGAFVTLILETSLRDACIFARGLKVHVVDDTYHLPKRVRALLSL